MQHTNTQPNRIPERGIPKLALGSVLCNKLVTLVLPDANNYTKSNNTQEV